MKTDKIFYTLFQVFPELLFQLMGEPPTLAEKYQFRSIEIKELAFRLDGVFLPDENYPDDPIYFLEVQFQEDEDFYWRFITEIFLYLNQYKPKRPCHAVVLWGSYNLDGGLPLPYQQLLVNQRIQRIYSNSHGHEVQLIKPYLDSRFRGNDKGVPHKSGKRYIILHLFPIFSQRVTSIPSHFCRFFRSFCLMNLSPPRMIRKFLSLKIMFTSRPPKSI
jgi:hypothetical protein